jgi:hypothetical protein
MLLGETYLRARYSGHTGFEELATSLEREVVEIAKAVFVSGVEVEYSLDEGSLIERAKVGGKTLAVVIGVVAGYHELRESVIDIYNDAHRFGTVVVDQFQSFTGIPRSEFISRRIVPKDVSTLRKIIKKTDAIDKEPKA